MFTENLFQIEFVISQRNYSSNNLKYKMYGNSIQ